jgi:hypothetical protein
VRVTVEAGSCVMVDIFTIVDNYNGGIKTEDSLIDFYL